jgi:signal transduction histidine kinase
MNAPARIWREPVKRDALLAAALTVYGQVESWTADGFGGPRGAVAAVVAITTAATAWRRRAALPVVLVVSALVMSSNVAWEVPDTIVAPGLALILACYSVGAHAPQRSAIAGLAFVLALMLGTALAQSKGLGDFLFLGTIFTAVWAAGRVVRSRRALAAQLADRTAMVEQHRDQQVAAAAAAERGRIARELHDVVAHCVNVMVLQAGAERRMLAGERPGTAEALAEIEDTGRQALGELRRLLGIVREEADAPPLEPQPTLADLPRLVEQVGSAGLPTELRVDGEIRALPPGLELSAYRIVQEALTNALKHARAESARVKVGYRPASLELEVVDDGSGASSGDETGGGNGLVGMRERVTLFDGTLQAGRGAGGGFTVSVRLPVPSADP